MMNVRMRIICENPPASTDREVHFSVPDKLGSLLHGILQTDGSLWFEFDLTVQVVNGAPQFSGVYAQGLPKERFIYLGFGKIVGDQWQWVKRLKIPLYTITLAQVQSGGMLEARVDGGGSGTVPLLGGGWQVR
jgi:hypothetical protein